MFVLEIVTDNAAFEDKDQEIARILRNAADRIEAGQSSGKLMDANGNSVGSFSVMEAI